MIPPETFFSPENLERNMAQAAVAGAGSARPALAQTD
jgi:hypothetical protein